MDLVTLFLIAAIIALTVWRFALNYKIYTRGMDGKPFNMPMEPMLGVRSVEEFERLNENGALLLLCFVTLFWSKYGFRSARTPEFKVNVSTAISVLLLVFLLL
jgi:hypothetical protein